MTEQLPAEAPLASWAALEELIPRPMLFADENPTTLADRMTRPPPTWRQQLHTNAHSRRTW